MGMKPGRSPHDDLDVRLQWPDAGPVGEELVDDLDPEGDLPRPRVTSLPKARLATEPIPADFESLVAAVDSMRAVIDSLVDALGSMRETLEATNSKVDRLAARRSPTKQPAGEVGERVAELTQQVELLRKRISLRARNEQLSFEAAERIAAAVIDTLADTIPEAGPRLRSRRRSGLS